MKFIANSDALIKSIFQMRGYVSSKRGKKNPLRDYLRKKRKEEKALKEGKTEKGCGSEKGNLKDFPQKNHPLYVRDGESTTPELKKKFKKKRKFIAKGDFDKTPKTPIRENLRNTTLVLRPTVARPEIYRWVNPDEKSKKKLLMLN